MKKNISLIVSFLAVAGMVLIGLLCFSDLTERKASNEKFAEFYEEEENFDVLFLGASHVLNGIFPMELWNEYGIVSYNMAGHENKLAMNYWILKNALEYTEPKLVVLDTAMLAQDTKIGELEQLHYSVDHIPYSQTKVEMIQDLVEDEERRSDFLWKFSTYHNRWNELNEQDFRKVPTPEKGAESRIDVAVPVEMHYFEENYKTPEEDGVGVEYVRKIIEECQARGIEILTVYLPFPDNTGWQGESNRMAEIAAEYDIDFLDYYTLLEQVNLNTDFYDKDSHMNPSGARKITRYLGNYIMENYAIEDQRESEAYSHWHDDYDVYTEFKKENLRKEEELKNILMLLNDQGFSYGIYFKPWNQMASYPVLIELLQGMGIDFYQIPNEDYFLFVDNQNGTRQEMRLFETLENPYGEFSMFYNEEGHLELTNSKADSMVITHSDIAIVIFDNRDLSFVDQAKFTLKDMPMEFVEKKEY
mgnify:CR=1 FL=1